MKYIKVSLIVALLLSVGSFSQSYSEESSQDLPAVRIEAEGVPFHSLIIRVGSPLYNFLRDMGRSLSSGSDSTSPSNLTDLGNLLLKVDSEYKNLEPNSFLILLSGTRFLKGDIYIPFSGTKAKYYLYRESLGIVELAGETISNSAILTIGRAVAQPVGATLSAILSDATLGQRLENDVLAIWESSRAPVYAFLDLLNKAKNVEITRSAKAAVRIPFAVADLGLVIGNKFLTLPFDIGKSAFDSLADSLGDHFADGSDNRDLLLLLIMGEKEIQPDRTVTLTGTIEDQGLFFGRAGSHRLQVTLNKDNRTLPLSINIRSKDIRFIDLNEYIGKRVTVRARFSAEKRLGMCCNLGYLLMVENINLAPQTQEQGGK